MLLTVDEFRAAVPATVPLSDEALQLLLNGTEAALTVVAGPGGTITELRDGGASYVILAYRAASITSISERWGDTTTELATDDWELRGDGRSIRRRADGTNPSAWWVGVVTVEYEAADRSAVLKLAQIELMKLEIASNPALAGQTVGNWSIQLQQGKTYAQLRQDILDSLSTNWQIA